MKQMASAFEAFFSDKLLPKYVSNYKANQ